jgi:hypothetical protein
MATVAVPRSHFVGELPAVGILVAPLALAWRFGVANRARRRVLEVATRAGDRTVRASEGKNRIVRVVAEARRAKPLRRMAVRAGRVAGSELSLVHVLVTSLAGFLPAAVTGSGRIGVTQLKGKVSGVAPLAADCLMGRLQAKPGQGVRFPWHASHRP